MTLRGDDEPVFSPFAGRVPRCEAGLAQFVRAWNDSLNGESVEGVQYPCAVFPAESINSGEILWPSIQSL